MRRDSALQVVSARLDAEAIAIDAVAVGVRSASDSLDTLMHLLDSLPTAPRPDSADGNNRNTVNSPLEGGRPAPFPVDAGGIPALPSPPDGSATVIPPTPSSHSGLGDGAERGRARTAVDGSVEPAAVAAQNEGERDRRVRLEAAAAEEMPRSTHGAFAAAISSAEEGIMERSRETDETQSLGDAISTGASGGYHPPDPQSRMTGACGLLRRNRQSWRLFAVETTPIVDARENGHEIVPRTRQGMIELGNSVVNPGESQSPSATSLQSTAAVVGEMHTAAEPVPRELAPPSPNATTDNVDQRPLSANRLVPCRRHATAGSYRERQIVNYTLGVAAGQATNQQDPPRNGLPDGRSSTSTRGGRHASAGEHVSIEAVLRESEALNERRRRVVVGLRVSALRQRLRFGVPTARVAGSPPIQITAFGAIQSGNRPVEEVMATEDSGPVSDGNGQSVMSRRTPLNYIDDMAPQDSGIPAAINGIDQERERLIREIRRLRSQQNESLIHLLRLQREHFLVRQRQVSTLSDIVDSFGRTVDAAWSLPHGEDSSLGRISGDVVSTLRRMLRVLSATVPHVETPGTDVTPRASRTTVSTSTTSAREPSSNITDESLPATSIGDLYRVPGTAGDRADSSVAVRSRLSGLAHTNGGGRDRDAVIRPAGDLTQQVIDAALQALPRLAAAASAISGAHRLQVLERNGMLAGDVVGIASTSGEADRRCSAETIAALPEAAPHSVEGCVICLSEGDSEGAGERSCHLPCAHIFHRACVAKWLRIQASCPTCRREVPNIAAVNAVAVATPVVPEV